MTDQEEIREETSKGGLRANQFSLMTLMVTMTVCAVGFSIWARLGFLTLFVIALNCPVIVFGTFCGCDAAYHRQPGWRAGVLIGFSLAIYGVAMAAYPLLTMPGR